MVNSVEDIFKDGWEVTLSTGIRRFEEDGDNYRDFHIRYLYEAKKYDGQQTHQLNSVWKGFDNHQDCIDDLIEKVNEVKEDRGI